MFLIWANPLLGPLEGLGHESLNFVEPKQLSKTQLQKSHASVPLKLFYQKSTLLKASAHILLTFYERYEYTRTTTVLLP